MKTMIGAHLVSLAAAAEGDGWVHIMPAGEIAGRDGRGPYRLEDPEAVLAASRDALLEMVVDYDHQTDLAAVRGVGGVAPAAGWIKELQAREDGIWGRVEWTEKGQAAIAAREYRYLSPVFHHTREGKVVRILRASLTNNPNLPVKALASREQSPEELEPDGGDMTTELVQQLAAALGAPDGTEGEALVGFARDLRTRMDAQTTAIASMAKAVGKGEDAEVDDVVTAVAAATTAQPDPKKYVPADLVISLQAQVNELRADKTAQVVDAAIGEGRLAPANRDWAISYHSQDPQGFAKFLEGQPAMLSPGTQMGGRQTPQGDGALNGEELALCARMGLSPEEFKKTREKEAH